MKKIKSLSESSFLKLFFGFFSVSFLIAAVCMPDRNTMFSGLWQILSQPSKVSTNYFAVGGYAATFLNMSLVGLICTLLYVLLKATPNSVSTLAVILTIGFGSWGINILNVWPTFLGVVVYCLVKREKLRANVNAAAKKTAPSGSACVRPGVRTGPNSHEETPVRTAAARQGVTCSSGARDWAT